MSRLLLSDLKKWGEGRDFGDKVLKLDTGSVIIDRNKFFASHVATLEGAKNRSNKAGLMPFYNRLVVFYELVENEKTL